MKGVILAGGTGTRLRPLTHTQPKQLVPIANKPVLQYALEDLRSAGITDIGIILGDQGREGIQSYFDDGSEFGVDITYIVQGAPLGVAHAVGCARDFVADESFVVYLGDNILAGDITEMVREFDPTEYGVGVGLKRVETPSRYGVVAFDDDDNIVKIVEKPDDPPTDLALVGIFVFTPDVFDAIERIAPSWRDELEITDAIQAVVDAGKGIQSFPVEGWWADTGKPSEVLEANRFVLDDVEVDLRGTVENGAAVTGRINLAEGAVVKDGAVVRGPAVAGKNTTIKSDAYVGPYTSVGDDCVLDNVHLAESIVIGGSEITCNCKIVDSLIGRNTTIASKQRRKPTGNRLILAEESSLVL